MIRGAPIGKRFEYCTFENYEVNERNREAFEACRRLAERGDTGVLLIGKNGLGKTHLFVAMMKEFDRRHSGHPGQPASAEDMIQVASASELIRDADGDEPITEGPPRLTEDEIERQVNIEYWPMLDLTSELRVDIGQGSRETSLRCRECDLLVLDDFGAERATDFVLEELERIVDWRYRMMKLTAVATNLNTARISEKYGQRAISRWAESCLIAGVTGDDRRPTKGPV